MRVTLIGIILVAILAVAAAEDPLAKAARLRDEGSEAFKAERYEEAVEKYEEAVRIYEEAGEKYLPDRVTLLRGICWNLTKAGKHEDCRAAWMRLATVTAGEGRFESDVASGYVAVATSSEQQADIEAQIAFLTPVREAAVRLQHPKAAAQVLHDMAFYLSEKGEEARAVPLLDGAVAERRKIRDLTGLAWSLNNLANGLVKLERMPDALPHLKEAFDLVHRMDVRAPQAGIAERIRSVIRACETGTEPSRKMRKFLWTIAFASAEAAPPPERILPVDFLIRSAIAADPDARNLGRAGRLEFEELPDEVRADVRITVARAWLAAGKASNAEKILKKLPTGDGPAVLHVMARLTTLRALVAAARKKKRDFREEANRAAELWRTVGEWDGQKAAFAELVEAVRALELEAEFRDLIAEQKRLASAGQPGGFGGSALSQGDRSGFAKLGARDPLFEFRMKDGKIHITDLVAKASHAVETKWQPRSVSLNGVTVWTYGGYVKVVSLAYGGVSATSGTPATMPLADLGESWPLPATGRLVLQKNGALRYE
ncbi:MAG: tetratricopeptide repeat protein [Planctomycetota bacterium]